MHIMSIVTYERRDNMGSTRYIMSIGELSRKDNSICFRKNGKNVYIPIENTKELFCLNEVSLYIFLIIMVCIVELFIQKINI